MSVETSKTEEQREKRLEKRKNIQGLQDNYKRCNVRIMKIPEGEKETRIMTENFPKLMSDSKPQIQEVQRMPGKISAPKALSRHIFKLQKIKDTENNLERNQRKKNHLRYRGLLFRNYENRKSGVNI